MRNQNGGCLSGGYWRCCYYMKSELPRSLILSVNTTLAANGRTQHFLPSVGKPTPPLKEGEELFPNRQSKLSHFPRGSVRRTKGLKIEKREKRKEQRGKILSNNIGVDPKVVCHTERSEVSLFSVFLRSFALLRKTTFRTPSCMSFAHTSLDYLLLTLPKRCDIICNAVTAHSSPLLPRRPPLRSWAC